MTTIARRVWRNARRTIACSTLFFATLASNNAPAAGGQFSVSGYNKFGNDTSFLASYSASTADDAGVQREIINDHAAELSDLPSYTTKSAATASIAGLKSYTYGEIVQITPRGGFGLGTIPVTASSLAIGRYDDVVVSGPAGSVTTSINMSLDGTLQAIIDVASSQARSRVEVGFYVNGGFVGGGDVKRDTYIGGGPGNFGILASWTGSGAITSPAFAVAANTPFTLEVRLSTSILASGYTGTGFDSIAAANFGHTLTFVHGSPVFNVPNGYSADSADAGIEGNSFVVPEPSTWALASSGLLLFGLNWRRRNPRQTSDS